MDFDKSKVDEYYNHIHVLPDFPEAYTTELFLVGKIIQDKDLSKAIAAQLREHVSEMSYKAYKNRSKILLNKKNVYEEILTKLCRFGTISSDLPIGQMFSLLGYENLFFHSEPIKRMINENLWLLERLDRVKEFSIARDTFETIPTEIGGLKSLEVLEIRGEYRTIPESIGDLENLKELKIKSSSLQKLPDSLQNLKQLEELDFSGWSYPNKFLQLPSWIGELENLSTLSFGWLDIDTIPEQIFPPTLEHLRMFRMQNVTSLPSCIGDLASLKTLRLAVFDRVTELPASLKKLNHLEELTFGNIPNIKSIDGNIVFSPVMKKCSVPNGIHVTKPDKRINRERKELTVANRIYLEHLLANPELFPNLELLRLRLVSLNGLSIGSLKQLKHLDIFGIDNVSEFLKEIGKCKNLKYLSISRSESQEIPTLKNLVSLQDLWIERCPKLEFSTDQLPPKCREVSIENIKKLRFGKYRSTIDSFTCQKISSVEGFDQIGDALQIKKLSLLFNKMSSIDGDVVLPSFPSSFSKMTDLVEFSFEGNIKKINQKVFQNSRLTKLFLRSSTPIEYIEPATLDSLLEVRLSNYKGFLEGFFDSIPNVQELYLTSIKSKILPIARMKKLKKFQVLGSFSEIDKAPDTLRYLHVRDCSNVGDAALKTIATMKNLKTLRLYFRRERIADRKSITLPDLSGLPLERFDLTLGDWELPDSIGKIKTLKVLCLDDMTLKNVPTSIADLPHLEYLSLRSYLREPLDQVFENLTIKELRMRFYSFSGYNIKREFYEPLMSSSVTKKVKEFSINLNTILD